MAVNKGTTFEKVANGLEPVGKVAKTAGAIFGCLSAGIGLGFKINELIKRAKEAKEGEVIDLDEIKTGTAELKPITPEEFDEIFGENKEEVE